MHFQPDVCSSTAYLKHVALKKLDISNHWSLKNSMAFPTERTCCFKRLVTANIGMLPYPFRPVKAFFLQFIFFHQTSVLCIAFSQAPRSVYLRPSAQVAQRHSHGGERCRMLSHGNADAAKPCCGSIFLMGAPVICGADKGYLDGETRQHSRRQATARRSSPLIPFPAPCCLLPASAAPCSLSDCPDQ